MEWDESLSPQARDRALDTRSSRALARIGALPADCPPEYREGLLSIWRAGRVVLESNLGEPSLRDMEDYAHSLKQDVQQRDVSIGGAVIYGRYYFMLDEDELARFLRRCIRVLLDAGARPAVLSTKPNVALFRTDKWGETTEDIVASILQDVRGSNREASNWDYLFCVPSNLPPIGWSELALPPDVDPARQVAPAPSRQEWVEACASLCAIDDVSLLSLAQAGRSRFGLADEALEIFVTDCVRAMLQAGAAPLAPTSDKDPWLAPILEGATPDTIVAAALDLLRREGEAPALVWSLCFGDPQAAPAPPSEGCDGAHPRRPGHDTLMVTPEAFKRLVSPLVVTARSKEAPPGYPGIWLHSPDGSVTGFSCHPTYGRMLTILTAGQGKPAPLPLIIHTWDVAVDDEVPA